MKKPIIIIASALSLITLSCARDYTCRCTYTSLTEGYDDYTSDSELRNTKKGAQDNCDQLSGGISYSGNAEHSVNCVLVE